MAIRNTAKQVIVVERYIQLEPATNILLFIAFEK